MSDLQNYYRCPICGMEGGRNSGHTCIAPTQHEPTKPNIEIQGQVFIDVMAERDRLQAEITRLQATLDGVKELPGKWRELAKGDGGIEGYTQGQDDGLNSCAADLERALATPPATSLHSEPSAQ